VLDEQALTVTSGSAHALVQLPQWFTSVDSLTQLPEQSTSPLPHVVPHALDEQTWPPLHAVAHAPQLALSEVVSVSHPLAESPSQSAKPLSHAPIAHVPALQVALAFA
jgi:hypothetical protein